MDNNFDRKKIKNIKNKKILFASVGLLFLFSFFLTSSRSAFAGQASLSLSPITGGHYQVGGTFSLNIWTKTGGANVDTIRASLIFPSNLLEAQSVTLGSVYNTPSGGNNIDNNNGTIYWGAGVHGGTTSDATFVTIAFKAKSAGTATISFTNDSLILSDGQAIPFIKASGVYILEAVATTPPVPTPVITQPKPATPAQQQIITPKTITNIVTDTSKDGDINIIEGKSSVGSAEIKFEIEGGLMDSTAQSDENGNWKWTAPKELVPGSYILRITAIHPEDDLTTAMVSQNFEVTITEALEVLFDVILDVDKDAKQLKPEDRSLPIHMKLLNFGENITANSVTNVSLTYIIEDMNKQVIATFNEQRSVIGRESDFDKTIQLPQDLKPGQYSIFAQMNYGENQEASSSDSFEILKPLPVSTYAIAILALAILLLILISKIIRATWKKKQKRK